MIIIGNIFFVQLYFRLEQGLLLEILIGQFERFEDSLSNFRGQ